MRNLDEPTKKEVRKILGALRRSITLLKLSARRGQMSHSEGELIHVTLGECLKLEQKLGTGPVTTDPIWKARGQGWPDTLDEVWEARK